METRLKGYQWLLEQGYSQDVLYTIALEFVGNGEVKAAYPIFKALGDYKDARERSEEAYAMLHTIMFDSQGGSVVASIRDLLAGEMIDIPKLPTKSGYIFGGWYKDRSLVSKWDFSSDSVVQDMTLYANWREPIIKGIGPAGGYIFYDKGSYSAGWRYLEAAPERNEFSSKVWGGANKIEVGVTGTKVGTGKSNTEKIVFKFGNAEPYKNKTDYAAKLCADLVVAKDGAIYDDWFLPSHDELNQIYENLYMNNLGGFSAERYWNSSEHNSRGVWGDHFESGIQNFVSGSRHFTNRLDAYRVRPIRAF